MPQGMVTISPGLIVIGASEQTHKSKPALVAVADLGMTALSRSFLKVSFMLIMPFALF
jgi:hypothetical protein